MGLIIKKKPTATITQELKEKGKTFSEAQAQETPELDTPDTQEGTPWCEVGVQASYTHNLGDFKSARVGVHLNVPCPHDEIDQVYEVAETWVNDRLNKMIADLTGDE